MSRAEKIKILILSICALLILVFLAGLIWQGQNQKDILRFTIKNEIYSADIADNDNERSKGLSGRSDLCKKCAMLFLFPEKGKYGFWMQGMNFDLDIVWLDGNRVVHIEENIPASYEKTMVPRAPADKVLEFNAGTCGKVGIRIGDEIELK